jgi:hypothetical protein
MGGPAIIKVELIREFVNALPLTANGVKAVVWSVIAPNVSNSMVAAFVQLFVPSPTIASFDVLTNVFIYSNAFFQSNPFLSCLYIHAYMHTYNGGLVSAREIENNSQQRTLHCEGQNKCI